MVKFYLATCLVYAICMGCLLLAFDRKLENRISFLLNSSDNEQNKRNAIKMFISLCFVPVIRELMFLSVAFLTITDEEIIVEPFEDDEE